MSERTFRAVVAAVLVLALVLASAVAFVALQPPSPSPKPSAKPTLSPAPTASPTPTPAPTPTPGPVFGEPGVTAVGSVPRGGESAPTFVLRFTEPGIDAIPDAPGSFTVTLTDHGGVGTTLAFTGTPLVSGPGSLGASVVLLAPNVLEVSIVASDTFNVEPITVSGLGIRASPEAAVGSISATAGAFSGSLAGGMMSGVLPTAGTVVAG